MENIFLALIQGLTEFLPISSSGHLFLIPRWFGWEDPGLSFSAVLHLGTLFAVLAYFWKDWVDMIKAYVSPNKTRSLQNKKNQFRMIVIATLPGAIIGFFWQDIFGILFREVWIVALFILIGSVFLWFAEQYTSRKSDYESITTKKAILIGLSQVIALFPGISRSGITIATGLFLGLSRYDALRFSFLMATPIILGASLLSFGNVWRDGFSFLLIGSLVVSFLSAYMVIAFMLRWIEKAKYSIFVWYGLGLACFALVGEVFF